MERPLLFEKMPALRGSVPWTPLGDYPTPVERMGGLCAEEGFSDFYVKRDDLSSTHYGGNKVRKLEFLLGRAVALRHSRMITFGAVGSNHVLATVIHGERLGIETIAVLWPQPNAAYVRKNLLLDYAHGARFAIASSMASAPLAFLRGELAGFESGGRRRPYFVPPGGSNPTGALGYIDGALELAAQVKEGLLPEPEFIFVTLGSSGTAAGLILGAQLAGLRSRVVAVRVVDKVVCNTPYLAAHVEATRRFVNARNPWEPLRRVRLRDVMVIDDFAGDCYAKFTEEGLAAVEKARRCDDIKLDGTYTGKTLAGAIDFMHRHGLQGRSALFWDTYSSVDLWPSVRELDYHVLPEALHRYFETPLQEEQMGREADF